MGNGKNKQHKLKTQRIHSRRIRQRLGKEEEEEEEVVVVVVEESRLDYSSMSSSSTILPLTPPPPPTKAAAVLSGGVNYDKNVQSMQRLRHSMIGDDDLFDEFTASNAHNHSHQEQQQQPQQHDEAVLPESSHHDDAEQQRRNSSSNDKAAIKEKPGIPLLNSSKQMRGQRKKSPNYGDTAGATPSSCILAGLGQTMPAVILIGLFHLMIGIPFGVSYFPIGWASSSSSTSYENNINNNTYSSINATPAPMDEADGDDDGDDVSLLVGTFPLTSGKEALGIRMFLFATMIGQVVYVFRSGFVNPIGYVYVHYYTRTRHNNVVVVLHS
jgi:hypothetical protein